MKKEPNKKAIGLFILVFVGAFAAIIGKVAISKIFTKSDNMVVMFFDESVKGLNVGSPIVFKGVEIGKVAKIDLLADVNHLDFKIPVYGQLDPNQRLYASDVEYRYEKEMYFRALIEKGLRARLASQSILTGQLMVEFEMLPQARLSLKGGVTDALEVPTVLSQMGELSKGLQNVPIQQTMEQFSQTLKELSKILAPTAEMADKLNRQSGATLNNLNQTMLDVGDAARAVRVFVDYLDQHPEALIRGKGK